MNLRVLSCPFVAILGLLLMWAGPLRPASASFVEKKVLADRDRVAVDWSPAGEAVEGGKTLGKPSWAVTAWGKDKATLTLRGADAKPHARSEVKEVEAKGGKKNLSKNHKGREFKLANPGTLTLTPVDSITYPNGEVFDPENGALEWKLAIDAPPAHAAPSTATNACWVMDLALPAGAQAFYQPPLTAEEVKLGDMRPEHIVGSYAIYSVDHRKLFHIPRPFASDAKGAWTWGRMEIAADLSTLTISILWAWLEDPTRKYPVVVDPPFGLTSKGGSSSGPSQNMVWAFGPDTPLTNGTLDSVSFGIYGANGQNFTFGLYSETGAAPGALVADSAGGTITGGYAIYPQNMDTNPAIANGTQYYFALDFSGSDIEVYWDSLAGPKRYYVASTYSAGTLPNTCPGSGTSNADRQYTAYASYTETAGGFVPYPITRDRMTGGMQ